MTPLILVMAAALATGSDASQTQAPADAAAPAATAPKPQDDSNKVVCRYEELTGSRFTRRVCRTRAEWKQIEDAAANYKRTIDDREGLQGAPSGPF